jgi:hypothetical protein
MIGVRLEDLHLSAININIRNMERRLRTNRNVDWTEMTDKERKWWQEHLRNKQKELKHFAKKYWRKEEYERYLERQAEMIREEQLLNS